MRMKDRVPAIAGGGPVKESDQQVEMGFVQIHAAAMAATKDAGPVLLDQYTVPFGNTRQFACAQRTLLTMVPALAIPGGASPPFL
jgi:hypothetical protein